MCARVRLQGGRLYKFSHVLSRLFGQFPGHPHHYPPALVGPGRDKPQIASMRSRARVAAQKPSPIAGALHDNKVASCLKLGA
jgi:hypothetical protein